MINAEQTFGLHCCFELFKLQMRQHVCTMPSMDYRNLLAKHIVNLSKSFDKNELAYLALTSKIENDYRV